MNSPRISALVLTLAAGFAAAGCSSIAGEIADLKERDVELADAARLVNDERKAVNQLMAALERLDREDSTEAEAEVAAARQALADAQDARD